MQSVANQLLILFFTYYSYLHSEPRVALHHGPRVSGGAARVHAIPQHESHLWYQQQVRTYCVYLFI